MGFPGRRLECVVELAQAVGVLPADVPILELVRPSEPVLTAEEESKVQLALTQTRNAQYESKKNLKFMRHNPSKSPFNAKDISRKEATSTLQEFFEAGCSAGEALMLINMGADVNISRQKSSNILKKLRGRDQEDIRSNLFISAVESGNASLVNVLAGKADQNNLDQGLKVALDDRNLEILEILMVTGADPTIFPTEFKEAVKSEDVEVVSILCSGARPLSEAMATENLYETVRSGHLSVVCMLLWHGASADIDFPSALECAIESGQIAIVAALCSAKQLPSPEHLARGIARVCADSEGISSQGLQMVELLLAAGADGNEVGETLIQATMQRQNRLVQLLVDYSQFDINTTPDAFGAAIMNADLPLFRILLTMVEDPQVLASLLLLLQTPPTREAVPLTTRTVMTVAIVNLGPTQEALTQGLCSASEHQEIEIVRCLVQAGASVDFQSGRILVVAIKLQSMELLTILLQGVPSPDTLSVAMSSLSDVPVSLKLRMTKALLNSGADGEELDRALHNAVEHCDKSSESYQLIKSLLQAGAKVDIGVRGCLVLAVEAADMPAFELLQEKIPSGSNPEIAFSTSSKLENLDARYQIMNRLLAVGARGPSITKALIDVLERIPREKRFSRLLVRKGDPNINLFEGRAVSLAVMHHDIELLRMLMEHQPTTDTLNNALPTAMVSEEGPTRLEICRILLQAGAKGDKLDDALVRAVISTPCDMELIRLFISSKASIDHNSGKALQIALEKLDIDLLNLLIERPCQPNTMIRALGQALTLKKEDQRLSVVAPLLNSERKLPAESLGGFLVDALGNEDDARVFRLLLSKGASVDVDPLEAFQKAIAMNSPSIMEALLSANPKSSTIRQVFEHAWKAREKNGLELLAVIAKKPSHRKSIGMAAYLVQAVEKTPCSIPLVTCLLDLEASVHYSESKCIQIAVKRLDGVVLDMLLKHVTSRQLMSAIFRAGMNHIEVWNEVNGIYCVRLLLSRDPSGEAVDENLLFATTQYGVLANAPPILNLLVAHGASSDYRRGAALQIAAQAGDMHLVSRLLDTEPSKFTISNAFPYVFKSRADDDTIIRMIDIFVAKSGEKLDLNYNHDELDPVMFMYKSRLDRTLDIMQRLLQAGALADQTMEVVLETACGQESSTILLETAHRASPEADAATVRLLIDRGGKYKSIITRQLGSCA